MIPITAANCLRECAAVAFSAAAAIAQNVPQGPLKISDLVHVELKQGLLVVTSDYLPGKHVLSQPVAIQGIDAPADLLIERNPRGKLTKFNLTLTTVVNGKTRTEILSLTPEAIEVIRDDTDDAHPDQPHSIELFQDAPGKHPRVELDRVDPDQTATELARGATFAELVSRHPHLAHQFLRPIMQDDLQMDDIFGPSNMLAKIVMAREFPLDAVFAHQVQSLVDQLNSDSFANRESARRRLVDLGPDAVIWLMSMDRTKLAPEQIDRVDEICRHAGVPSLAEMAELRQDVPFLLKCQLSEDRTIRMAALEVLQKAVGHDLKFDVDADYAARTIRIAILRDQLAPTTSPSLK